MDQQELNILITQAKEGDIPSQLKLSALYYVGEDVEKSYEKCIFWTDTVLSGNCSLVQSFEAYYRSAFSYVLLGKCAEGILRGFKGYDICGLFYQQQLSDQLRNQFFRFIDASLQQIKQGVDNGDPNAQYVMGRLYHEGWFVEKDYNKAYLLYEKAAQQGHDKAQFDLGMFCMGAIKEGYAYFVDYKEEQRFINYDLAYSMFLNSAKQGNVFAYLAMGHRNLWHWKEYSSHKKDILLWINKARDRKAPLASFLIYEEYKNSLSDFNLASDCLKEAIDRNCPDALDEIGYVFLRREPLELENIETAENYYDKIYESGCHRQYFRHIWSLSWCFLKLKQFEKFLLWATRASECDRSQNYMHALVELAKIYLYDYQKINIEQDIKKSKECCLKAINPGVEIHKFNIDYVKSAKELLPIIELFEKGQAGDAEAQYQVANLYYLGENEHFKRDKEVAKQWFLKSAQNGYIESYYELSKIVFLTEGDGKTAFEYCQKAAEKGHKKAQVLLPIIQNFVIASQGDATAQCYVGMYYEEGNEFIKQNLEKAESWYKKAMLNGNQNAAVLLSGVQMKLNNKESEAQRESMERMKREMESMREESERNRDAAEKSLAEARKSREDAENSHRQELEKIREEAEKVRRDREAAEREREDAANDLRQAQQERDAMVKNTISEKESKSLIVRINYTLICLGASEPWKRHYTAEMSEDLYNKLSLASEYEIKCFLKNRGEDIRSNDSFYVDEIEIE